MEACRTDTDPLQLLSGTSLRTYLYMLRHGVVGVREVQRALGLRSPSTAKHHLDRLVSLGLAVKTSRGYYACKPTAGLLTLYMVVAGRLVPRIAGLAAAITVLSIATCLHSLLIGSAELIAAAMLWVEVVRLAKSVKKLEGLC